MSDRSTARRGLWVGSSTLAAFAAAAIALGGSQPTAPPPPVPPSAAAPISQATGSDQAAAPNTTPAPGTNGTVTDQDGRTAFAADGGGRRFARGGRDDGDGDRAR